MQFGEAVGPARTATQSDGHYSWLQRLQCRLIARQLEWSAGIVWRSWNDRAEQSPLPPLVTIGRAVSKHSQV